MSDRRRFLQVFGATAAALGVPACGGDVTSGGGGGGGTTGATTTAATTGAGGGGAGGAGGSGGQGGDGGQGGSPCDPNPPGVTVGMPGAFATDGLHKVQGTKVLIGRDADGLYALTSLCPHQFCNMNIDGSVTASGITCTCHNSKFNNAGTVTKGPANKGLKAFALALACDGTLRADTTTIVPATDRLKV